VDLLAGAGGSQHYAAAARQLTTSAYPICSKHCERTRLIRDSCSSVRKHILECLVRVVLSSMQGRSRKRPVSSPDASAFLISDSVPIISTLHAKRVSSDVRPRPGKNLLRLLFPHESRLLPVHSVGALSPVPIDDDGDAAVARRPRTSHQDGVETGTDLELFVRCGCRSNVENCGQQVWGASLLLAEYLWSVRRCLSGASVLELGAGLAIPSVCISRFCRQILVSDCNKVRPPHYFLTHCHQPRPRRCL
jgi:hypothetical protein